MRKFYYLRYDFNDGLCHIKEYYGNEYYYKDKNKLYADIDIDGELCNARLSETYLSALWFAFRTNFWIILHSKKNPFRDLLRCINGKDIVIYIVLVASIIFMLFSMFGCATTKEYRNTSNIQHDTIRITNTELRVDSVWRDRVQLIEIKGDSVYIRDSVVVEKWRLKNVMDTFWYNSYQTITDSVYVETPKIKRERSKYDIFTSYGFWIELVLLLIIFVIVVVKTIIKIRKLV